MASFDSTQPFRITVPDAALTTSNGEAVVDLTPNGIDAADLTLSNLSSVATARTNLGGTATGVSLFTAASAAAAATAVGATAAGSAILTAANAGAQRTAMGVPATADVTLNSDPHLLHTSRVNLIDTSSGTVTRQIPLFAGTMTDVAIVIDGATTAAGDCSADITIDGVAVVLTAPLLVPSGSVAGFKVVTTVASGGAFTASQTIEVTTTSLNTAATLGNVSMSATMA